MLHIVHDPVLGWLASVVDRVSKSHIIWHFGCTGIDRSSRFTSYPSELISDSLLVSEKDLRKWQMVAWAGGRAALGEDKLFP